jgi:tetratricopeptide (TPR) repeat protein
LIAADLNMMGYLYHAKNQPEDVMRAFKQAQELIGQSNIPENIKENFKRFYPYYEAQIALMKNDFDLAKKKQIEFQKETEKVENPYQIRLAHELTGQIALAEEKYPLAIEQLEMANQQNARNLYRIASAYEGMRDLEKALDYYERAANFNAFMDMEFALIRNDAEKKAAELRARIKSS